MNLTNEDAIRLLSGSGMWHTSGIPKEDIPAIHLSDGPNGLRAQSEEARSITDSIKATCFPGACALASSWDTDAAATEAEAIAEEAIAADVSVVLGPGVNMKRSPLCGRNFEYLSEDPFLAGTLAAAYIKAMQKKNVGVSLKHFAANSQETRRQTADSVIDERALREIYLRAFEIAVREADPATIMASYNKVNGKYSCENRKLLTRILRDEWGFDGVVVSDWGACASLMKSVLSGMDLEMPTSAGIHAKKLKMALSSLSDKKKKTLLKAIHTSAMRVAALAEKYDPESVDRDFEKEKLPAQSKLLQKNHGIARDIAEKSAVLLKNDGILPITDKTKKIAVIGDLAENMRIQGGGSSHINAGSVTTAVNALKYEGYSITFERGYDHEEDDTDESLVKRACAAAKDADIVLFFGGLTDRSESEGYDRKTLSIPENQLELIDRLYEVNKELVFISFSGAPFEMPFIEKFRAVLHMYLGGEAVGEAVSSLVSGRKNPSGKLAETFPLSLSDVPCRDNFGKDCDSVEYRESIFMGYRYYSTFEKPVLFPFGYGLSYTEFSYDDLECPEKYEGGKIKISFTVENTGKCDGAEVAEVYAENPSIEDGFLRPKKELIGFTKVFLKAGEKKRCTVTLNERSFSIWDNEENAFSVISGKYKILVGASSEDIRLSQKLKVKGKKARKDEREAYGAYFEKEIQSLSREDFETLYGKKTGDKSGEPHRYTVRDSLRTLSKKSLTAKMLLGTALISIRLMNIKKRPDDPEFMMMREMIINGNADAISLQSRGGIPYRLVERAVREANRKGKR